MPVFCYSGSYIGTVGDVTRTGPTGSGFDVAIKRDLTGSPPGIAEGQIDGGDRNRHH
jgi:hypothetical protein